MKYKAVHPCISYSARALIDLILSYIKQKKKCIEDFEFDDFFLFKLIGGNVKISSFAEVVRRELYDAKYTLTKAGVFEVVSEDIDVAIDRSKYYKINNYRTKNGMKTFFGEKKGTFNNLDINKLRKGVLVFTQICLDPKRNHTNKKKFFEWNFESDELKKGRQEKRYIYMKWKSFKVRFSQKYHDVIKGWLKGIDGRHIIYVDRDNNTSYFLSKPYNFFKVGYSKKATW